MLHFRWFTGIWIPLRDDWLIIPSKYLSLWRSTEDVLSWRRLQCNIFCFPRRLDDSFIMSLRQNCKISSWRRLKDVLQTTCWKQFLKKSWRRFGRSFGNMSWRHLQDFFTRSPGKRKNVSWRHLQDVLKKFWENFLKKSSRLLEHIVGRRLANMSWRRLEEQKNVTLKTSSRRFEDVLKNKISLLGYQWNRCSIQTRN